jgi:hypothetical protein
LLLIAVSTSFGEIAVFDRITTVRTPVRIIVLTKGRFFAKGGMLADIYLDDEHLKKILTGGDGYGYLKYVPQVPGFVKITARAGKDEASGLILVMDKNEKAIIIETEAGFKDTLLSEEIRKNSQKAVNSLSKKYKIIYLSKYVGKGISRSWLEKNDFPSSVIFPWRGPQLFATLKEKGVQVHAIIGSSAVISEAKNYIENRYTFEESKEGKTVQDWEEIVKLLE